MVVLNFTNRGSFFFKMRCFLRHFTLPLHKMDADIIGITNEYKEKQEMNASIKFLTVSMPYVYI